MTALPVGSSFWTNTAWPSDGTGAGDAEAGSAAGTTARPTAATAVAMAARGRRVVMIAPDGRGAVTTSAPRNATVLPVSRARNRAPNGAQACTVGSCAPG